MTSGGEENVGATPADSILGHLATYSRVWSPLSDVVLVCSDGLLPAHKLVLAALSPLLRSALAEADTWDETVSVVMPDFSIQQVSRYLADIFTCEDLGQHPEINAVFGHCVEEISPLVDIIDIKDECLTQTNSSPLADIETGLFSHAQNGESVELERKPEEDNRNSELQLKDNKRALGKLFPCPHCEYKATKKGSLQGHIKSVHDGQKFQCPNCEYKATIKGNLQRHIQSVHEGKKFPCPHCDYKATFQENLQKHIKAIHEGNLQKHIKSVHEGHMFPCPQCNNKFTQKGSLQRHIKSVHDGQKFPCTHCEYKATRRDTLKSHIKSSHERPDDDSDTKSEREYFEEDRKPDYI